MSPLTTYQCNMDSHETVDSQITKAILEGCIYMYWCICVWVTKKEAINLKMSWGINWRGYLVSGRGRGREEKEKNNIMLFLFLVNLFIY